MATLQTLVRLLIGVAVVMVAMGQFQRRITVVNPVLRGKEKRLRPLGLRPLVLRTRRTILQQL